MGGGGAAAGGADGAHEGLAHGRRGLDRIAAMLHRLNKGRRWLGIGVNRSAPRLRVEWGLGGQRVGALSNLIVTSERADHIACHGATVEEVWEVVRGAPAVERTRLDRFLVIGQTFAGRYLTLVVAPRREGGHSLVTARDADDSERRRFRRQRGE